MRGIAALLLTTAACGDDGGAGRGGPAVVEVAAQPCATPNRSTGLGVVVADGLVATAAHTVDVPLRALTVEGRPASVRALDRRTDLALLTVDVGGEPVGVAPSVPRDASVATPDAAFAVEIVRTGPLVVEDTTAGERHERAVHTFTPGVTAGTSGAPLLDREGRLLGVVVLYEPGDDVAHAVTADEVGALLADPGPTPAARGCPSG